MVDRIWWVHEKALFMPEQKLRCVHVWDDAYYQSRGYSLKRLVFIYETLCQMPVEIIFGDTQQVLIGLQKPIETPCTADSQILALARAVSQHTTVHWVSMPEFVHVDASIEFPRFYRYWKQAQKTAFFRHDHE
jgi:hypothetical protein